MNPSEAAFFEQKYQADPDPWHFASNPTETSRYDRIIAALSHRRYRSAFEPGCSVGVLSARLAPLCDALECIDFSPTALETARARCAEFPHVWFRCMGLPVRLPVRGCDLLVLSEIGYYFSAPEWSRIAGEFIHAAEPGATLLACHWLGSSPDHKLSGDQVHMLLDGHPLLRREHAERHPSFRLNRWTRIAEPRS